MRNRRTILAALALTIHATSADATTYLPDRLAVRCRDGLVSVDGKPVVGNTPSPQPGDKGEFVIGSGPLEIRYRYVRERDRLVFTVTRLPTQYFVLEGDPMEPVKTSDRFEIGRRAHVMKLLWLPKRDGKAAGQEPREERVILSFHTGEVASSTDFLRPVAPVP